MRDWLRRPLVAPERIARRHNAVGELVENAGLREELRGHLAAVGDPERLLGRAVLGSMTPREAMALREGLRRTPDILDAAARCQADLLAELAAVDPLLELAAELGRVLAAEPPATFKNSGGDR